jgi:hypothetical protein
MVGISNAGEPARQKFGEVQVQDARPQSCFAGDWPQVFVSQTHTQTGSSCISEQGDSGKEDVRFLQLHAVSTSWALTLWIRNDPLQTEDAEAGFQLVRQQIGELELWDRTKTDALLARESQTGYGGRGTSASFGGIEGDRRECQR